MQSREVPGGDPVLSLGDFFFSNVGMETQCMDLAPPGSPNGTLPPFFRTPAYSRSLVCLWKTQALYYCGFLLLCGLHVLKVHLKKKIFCISGFSTNYDWPSPKLVRAILVRFYSYLIRKNFFQNLIKPSVQFILTNTPSYNYVTNSFSLKGQNFCLFMLTLKAAFTEPLRNKKCNTL